MNTIQRMTLKNILLVLLLLGTQAQAETRYTYYHNDLFGSPVAMTDQAGNVIARKDYTPYGEASGNDGTNHVGFTGHAEDQLTHLVYMQQRLQDPKMGRFLSIDSKPIDPNDPATFNRYAYANNNPYRYTDPDGKESILITSRDFGIGTHSALYVNTPGQKPFLYDPAGSYQPKSGEPRGEGGTFEGADASLKDYADYQKSTGSTVTTTTIPTTPEQEAGIKQRAENQNAAQPFECATKVSGALGGVFGIKTSGSPGVLEDNAKKSVKTKDAKK